MILILTFEGDPVAADGERMLRARGVPFARIEGGRIGDGVALTQRFGATGAIDQRIDIDGVTIDLREVTAVWHRRHLVPAASTIQDPRQREFARIETEDTLVQLWAGLDARFLPAPLGVIRRGQAKLEQLRLATALGFEIPPSIVTTAPQALLEFHREHGGRVITKLISTRAMNDSGLSHEYLRFTEDLTVRDLAARSSSRLCPVYAQAKVPKRLELRLTVVGRQVFAAEIHSQRSRHAQHDWRKAGPTAVPYRRHELPAPVADRCVALTEALGLTYGAIDMIVRPDGGYVFLEINPGGEFHWVEQRTGLPITAAIVEFLAGDRPSPGAP